MIDISQLQDPLEILELVRQGLDRLQRERYGISLIDQAFYNPSDALINHIESYKHWCENPPVSSSTQTQKEDYYRYGGQLMEQIAYLAFKSLHGFSDIGSFITIGAEAQLDLIVSGEPTEILNEVCKLMGLASPTQKIIIEAKNKNEKVNSNTFSRLCYIIQNGFEDQCSLGIFFAREGATGFNKHKYLTAAKATQILFYARTGKHVIVFDHSDIISLSEMGKLPELIRDKISNLLLWQQELMTDHSFIEYGVFLVPPDHLANL